jgi:hypothetical protein
LRSCGVRQNSTSGVRRFPVRARMHFGVVNVSFSD